MMCVATRLLRLFLEGKSWPHQVLTKFFTTFGSHKVVQSD